MMRSREWQDKYGSRVKVVEVNGDEVKYVLAQYPLFAFTAPVTEFVSKYYRDSDTIGHTANGDRV